MTDDTPTRDPQAPRRTLVACLCARWCRTCDEYRATFDRLAQRRPQTGFLWLDVEDDAEFIGNIDVDDFPTLLIVTDGAPRFFGPLTPQQSTLERLLDWADSEERPPATPFDDPVRHLAARLRSDRDPPLPGSRSDA